MSHNSKDLIKKEFLKLLQTKSINEITVKDITKCCEINRNTFYYYFDGLPSLVEEIIDETVDNIISKCSNISSIPDALDDIVNYILNNKKIFQNLYRYSNTYIVRAFISHISEYISTSFVSTISNEVKMSDKSKTELINLYKWILIGFFTDWFENGMDQSSIPNILNLLNQNQLILKTVLK